MSVTNDRPCLAPTLGKVLAHRPRMLATADNSIAVVVYLDEVMSPDNADGKVRGQTDVDGGTQAVRPGHDRTERSPRPVLRANKRAHLATAGQPIADCHYVEVYLCTPVQHHASSHRASLKSEGWSFRKFGPRTVEPTIMVQFVYLVCLVTSNSRMSFELWGRPWEGMYCTGSPLPA